MSSNVEVWRIFSEWGYFVFTKYTSDAELWPNFDWSWMEVESPLSLNCLEELFNNGITIAQDNWPTNDSIIAVFQDLEIIGKFNLTISIVQITIQFAVQYSGCVHLFSPWFALISDMSHHPIYSSAEYLDIFPCGWFEIDIFKSGQSEYIQNSNIRSIENFVLNSCLTFKKPVKAVDLLEDL